MTTIDYENGKIYKIESHLGDKIYVGSTSKKYLSQRMTAHKYSYRAWKIGHGGHNKAYDLFDEYGLDNCSIVLIEACPCKSRDELHAREGHYIKNMECVNKMIAGRSRKEYKEDNLEKIKERDKKYSEEHKEEKKEYDKKYREDNKDKIKEYQHKYINEHKEDKKEYDKKYKESRKEQKKEYDRLYRLKKKQEKAVSVFMMQ